MSTIIDCRIYRMDQWFVPFEWNFEYQYVEIYPNHKSLLMQMSNRSKTNFILNGIIFGISIDLLDRDDENSMKWIFLNPDRKRKHMTYNLKID